ncbi:pentatricopeptide repeat-containing protein At5g48910-like [Spinacia oleracea]|uniref:Pentatricopeptide repeat-containing protein At5g48910-like n=1 Tax=Spinacia oleracea TaxID=3562 RepID=A0A9R0HTP9_SPIOL|nr:pentatricopeptide repeat-containing protein At5g48910-like [Spinacia oleracea]
MLACASLLELCCGTKNLQNLRILHSQTIKLGFSCNDFIRAKLVSSYTACAEFSDAELMFSFTNRKFTFLYNTFIRGYASTKQFHLSLSSFHQLLQDRKPIDLNTLPAVLKSVAALSYLRIGRRIHSFVLVHGFGFDIAHCNALITMYCKCGELESARKVFDKMPRRNLITWSAMMGGYGMHGNADEVFCLFDKMLVAGVWPDEVMFTTILTACSHGGRVKEGEEYFEMMVEIFHIRPTKEHCSCMVDMLGRAGKIEEARGIIESMEMEPDACLWRAFLGACKIQGKSEIIVRGKLWRLTD